jgi:hypothetical protein
MISDFRQRPIPTVHKDHITMKARVKKRHCLRVQVIAKVR